MLETVGDGDLLGMEGILPGTTHGITVLGPIIHGTARLGVGVVFIAHGITVHGMAHPGDGVEVTGVATEAITEVIMDTAMEAIMEEAVIIHLLTHILLMDVQLQVVIRAAVQADHLCQEVIWDCVVAPEVLL